MNYIKQNHLALLSIILVLALGYVVITDKNIPLGALDRTTVSNPWTFAGAVTHSSTLTQTGAATFASTISGTSATLSSTLAVSGATSLATLTQGGGIRSTSTNDTTATFLAADFDVEGMIEFVPNVTGITATLPATSTLSSFIATAGQSRSLKICNATTTASTPFTLAFGTGMNDHLATSTLAIETGDCAVLEFFRATDTDIEVFYNLGY